LVCGERLQERQFVSLKKLQNVRHVARPRYFGGLC